MKIWLDGKIVDKQDAKLSVFDHATLYGDGIFEGIRAYGGKVFEGQAHVDRFFASAASIRLTLHYTKQQVLDILDQTVKATGYSDCYIRLVATRGEGTLGLSPFQCGKGSLFCIAGLIALYPPEMYENGMPVIIAKTVRISPRMLNPAVKSLNYLNSILAQIECHDAGVSEAIMLNENGFVAEATGDNVFIIKAGQIFTPPPEAGILVGVTRNVVMKLASELKLPLTEKMFKPDELFSADECFLTGTAAEVVAITKIDGKTIGTGAAGPITKQLLQAFRQFVTSGK
jgi:branched-chain amino acid aminotransferase